MRRALLAVAVGAVLAGAAAIVLVPLLAAWEREEHRQQLLRRERLRPARLLQSVVHHRGDNALHLVVSSGPN